MKAFVRAFIAACGLAVPGNPVFAASTTTTGVIAGLGLTAASGKSTISGGGGQIEASLLSSDMMLEAGRGIRHLVSAKLPNGSTVILLGHADPVELSMARWLSTRISDMQTQVNVMVRNSSCKAAPIKSQLELFSGGGVPTFAPTDITAAIMTDTSIAGITINADDRTIVNAVEMAGNDDLSWHDSSEAGHATLQDNSEARRANLHEPLSHFVVLGERVDVDPSEPTIAKLTDLQHWANEWRHCTSAEYKAAVSD